ncbi:sulfurtransferase TusA family protein [Desulfomonile tiedjei]|uniref:Putative redox protein, regulator of disulfide bond formation n=1 Tax=Desulfomonile tiedjei (strain ATCC 49306 / DSM 6799 / DCB-1) TaxID=706587 RepID=I4C7Y8_DESTA|nr:sulfurtransferase TusA family protein [Desulfomonile tiedjei]AFM25679.1 putative redox protein, regulator of disulfide bond formation [Desulfomonile tiedjei DSM 6799]
MSDHKVAKVLDLKGLPCPMPVVKMSQEIGSVSVGEIIEVHTTDPGSLSDFPAWADTTGNEVLETKQGNGSIQIFVKRLK